MAPCGEGARGLPGSEAEMEECTRITGHARVFSLVLGRTQRLACHAGHPAPGRMVIVGTFVLVTMAFQSSSHSQHHLVMRLVL